jgi:hypothetical protein
MMHRNYGLSREVHRPRCDQGASQAVSLSPGARRSR